MWHVYACGSTSLARHWPQFHVNICGKQFCNAYSAWLISPPNVMVLSNISEVNPGFVAPWHDWIVLFLIPPKHHARSRNTKTTTTTPFPRFFHLSLFSLDVFLFSIIFVHASSTSRRQTLPTDRREIAGKLANRYNLCMRVHERAY